MVLKLAILDKKFAKIESPFISTPGFQMFCLHRFMTTVWPDTFKHFITDNGCLRYWPKMKQLLSLRLDIYFQKKLIFAKSCKNEL